mmetsp:Transcript_46887/g.71708  ORF Transcript_46887/g.71708 Transcript_46887/m.71708 type:complete len:169 (-) Transcript_46887:98-604(-)
MFYLNMCEEVFGTVLIPDVDQTNVAYGALSPWGTNYAFVSTTSDPFRALVINETSLPQSKAIHIPTLTSIFSFLAGTNVSTSIEQGRDEILSLIREWVDLDDVSPSISPTPFKSPIASVTAPTVQSDNSTSWTLYAYMVVGVLCLLLFTGIAVVAILKYAQGKINAAV